MSSQLAVAGERACVALGQVLDQLVAQPSARALQHRPPVRALRGALAVADVREKLLAHPALEAGTLGLLSLLLDDGLDGLRDGDIGDVALGRVAPVRVVLAGIDLWVRVRRVWGVGACMVLGRIETESARSTQT